MAVTAALLATSTTLGSAATTATFAHKPKTTLVATAYVQFNSDSEASVSSRLTVSGGGYKWTKVAESIDQGAGPNDATLQIWVAQPYLGSIAYTTVTATADLTGGRTQTCVALQVHELTGVPFDPKNIANIYRQTKNGGGGSSSGAQSLTLDKEPLSTSGVYAAAVSQRSSAPAITTGTGWTQLSSNTVSTILEHTQFRASSTSTSVGWNSITADAYWMVAVEFVEDIVERNRTRLYFNNTTPGIGPSLSSGWNRTTQAIARQVGTKLGNGEANALRTDTATGTIGHYVATHMFISGPLAKQSLRGSVAAFTWFIKNSDTQPAITVRVLSNDGTVVRGTPVALQAPISSAYTDRSDGPNAVSDDDSNEILDLSTLISSDGDRLSIEFGFCQSDTQLSVTGNRFNFPNGGQFYDRAAVYDDSAGSGHGSSFIEFSDPLVFKEAFLLEARSIPEILNSALIPSNATTTLTPDLIDSGARKGDLIWVFCQSRANATWSIGVDGGQSWTSETAVNNTRIFWCVFNGTWTANPRFDSTSGTCTTVVAHVYRAPSIYSTWTVENALANTSFAAPSSPFTVTRTGVTTGNDNCLVIAAWKTSDDNGWTSLSGSGWSVEGFPTSGVNAYRNAASTDQSCAFAWKWQASAGATGDVSLNQTVVTGDAGYSFIQSFRVVTPHFLQNDEITATPVVGTPTLTENGAGDNLTATGIATGAPTVGTPAITQTHALTATGITASPTIGTPALTQAHALTATGIDSGAPTVGTPALGQTYPLTATGIATGAPSVGSPAITQSHALTATGLNTAAPSVGAPAITQVHSLTATGISTGSPTVGTPTLAHIYNLTATGIATGAPVVDTPTLGQSHPLTTANLATGAPTVGTPAITQVHALAATGITATPAMPTPALVQIHGLTATGIATGAPTVGAPTVGQTHPLTATGVDTGAPTVGTPAIAQVHSLSATGITASPVLDTATLAQIHALTATGIATGAPTVGTPSIVDTTDDLEATGIATGAPTVDTPALAHIHVLTATGVATGAPTVGTPLVAQTHVLTATAVATGAPTVGSPPVTQTHVLAATGIATGAPTVGTPSIVDTNDELDANGIATGAPTVGGPALGQVHGLTTTPVATGAPTVATPVIGQVHVLTATGISTGAPTLDQALLSIIYILSCGDLSTGPPTIGAPSLAQVHSLTASGIATGAPSIGAPAIAQEHGLTATGVDTGAPTVGTPTLASGGVFHNLVATGIDTGAPELGNPILGRKKRGRPGRKLSQQALPQEEIQPPPISRAEIAKRNTRIVLAAIISALLGVMMNG